jgi:hypothetical protein
MRIYGYPLGCDNREIGRLVGSHSHHLLMIMTMRIVASSLWPARSFVTARLLV